MLEYARLTRASGFLFAVLVPALLGCGGSGDGGEGPLGDVIGNTRVEECSPSRRGASTTIGDIYLTNPTRFDLTLTGVSLATTEGVTLVGAAIGDNTLPLVAAGSGYPPTGVAPHVWDQVQPLPGAVLAPGDAEVVIMVGLRLDHDRGRAATVLIDYEVDGRAYRVKADRDYSLGPHC